MKDNRNDLEQPAIQHCSEISDCLEALLNTKPAITRMSGSGASCFALYNNENNARAAAQSIMGEHPNWFVTSTYLRGQN